MTERLDLTASRNETWRPTIEYIYSGDPAPLEGASIQIQWRLYPGAPGAPVISIPNISFTDEATPSASDAALRTLSLFPGVAQSVLQSLPTGRNRPEPGEADVFAYDAVITYADGMKDRFLLGQILLDNGVTR